MTAAAFARRIGCQSRRRCTNVVTNALGEPNGDVKTVMRVTSGGGGRGVDGGDDDGGNAQDPARISRGC